MPREPSRLRRQLGQELKRLRSQAGLPLRGFGDDIPHPRVHRIEAGTALPVGDQLDVWLTRTGADPDTAERIRLMSTAAHSETVRWDTAIANEGGHLQGVAADRERDSTRLLTFEHAHLPGLLQTAAYAQAVFASFNLDQDHAAAVQARLRRQELLYEAGREFRFVFPERLLTWPPGPDVPMTAQQAKVRDVDGLDTATIGILPDSARLPLHGFVVHEGMTDGTSMVVVELEHGEPPLLTDPEVVDEYRRLFAQLEATARPAS